MIWDHSSRQKYQACPRKWLLEEHYLLSPKEDSMALVRGGAIHHGIATWYQKHNVVQAGQEAIGELIRRGEISEMELTQDFKDLIINCLMGYTTRYPEEPFEVLDVELSMCADMGDGDYYFGVVDGIISQNSTLLNKETKTTTLMPAFLEQRYTMDEQTLGYMWLCLVNNISVRGVLLDLVRVPNGKNVKYPEFYRSLHFPDEGLLAEWEEELRSEMHDIKVALQEIEERHLVLSPKFPKNTRSCFDWNKKCGFHDFCSRPSLQHQMWSMFPRKSTARTERIMEEAKALAPKLNEKYKERR